MRLLFIVFMAIGLFATTQAQTADLKAGQAKYQQLCATCHGAAGKGDGPAAVALNPKPRNLSTTTKTDTELKAIISKGGAASGLSPIMPAWGAALSEQELANVIAYIRSLKK